jgi:hypothetical protein
MKIEITNGAETPVTKFFSAAPASSRSCCNLRAKRIAQLLNEKEEARLDRERIEEALKELSSIHQWIDRNHPDGFIDSLTYFQNLERVTDNWYDRLDRLEVDAKRFVRERDEARELLAKALVRGDLALAETKKAKEELFWSDYQDKREMQRERDEALHKLELCMAANSDVARIAKERDEAREQNAKLREIADALGGALERLDALYRSEQDSEAPMPRPDWLRRPLQMLDAELDRLKEGAK